MTINKFQVDHAKNYLTMIENSVGSRLFAQLWVDYEDGRQEDISRGGELSCAIFVSGILKLNDRIAELSATVNKLVERMMTQGWQEVAMSEIQPGDVLVWDKLKSTDETGQTHGHIGFYIGDHKAISNSTKLKKIVRHGWDYGGRRKIVKVLRWPVQT